MTGEGRLFLGPEPERGWGHPGYRGTLVLDGAWVHIPAEAGEFLEINEDTGTHEWVPLDHDISIPAAAVDQIDWTVSVLDAPKEQQESGC